VEDENTVQLVAEYEFASYKPFLEQHERFETGQLAEWLKSQAPSLGQGAIYKKCNRTLQKMMLQGVIGKIGRGKYEVLQHDAA